MDKAHNKDTILQQTLQLLDILSGETNAMVAAMDNDMHYTYLNKAYQDEVGRLSGKQVQVGMSIEEVYANMPDQLKTVIKEWQFPLNGEKTSKTILFGDPDHYQKVYNSSHIPLMDSESCIIGACVVAYDVTEKTHTEESQRQTEASYKSLFTSMSEGFVLYQVLYDDAGKPADYQILDANAAFETQTGATRQAVIGKTLSEILPGESQDWIQKFTSVALTGKSKHVEIYSQQLNKHFGVIAYQPNEDQLATVFTDITEQKHSDQVRNWLSSFPEYSPLPIFEIDLEDKISYQNPACQQLFSDLTTAGGNHPLLSGIATLKERLQEAQSEQAVFEVHIGNAWYQQTIIYVTDKRSFRIYSVDITDRVNAATALRSQNLKLEEAVQLQTQELQAANKKLKNDVRKFIEAEKALKHEQQRFYEVLEILPLYLVLISPDHHIAFANRYFREHFGEPKGKLCHECLFNKAEPCQNCESFIVFDTKRPHHWSWSGPDQREYDVYDFPFKDSDGSSLILEMGIDITEKFQAENQLRTLNAYNRSLIEANLDTLVTITPDGKIGDVNIATESITGYHRDELVGTDFHSYFTDPDKARAGYRQVFEKGSVHDYELEMQHKNGLVTPVAYNASLYRDEAGEVAGVFAGARDLTRLKDSEKQLLQLNTALEEAMEKERVMHNELVQAEKFTAMGRMLASITHELNNPLQTIKNCLYLVYDDLPAKSQAIEFLDLASSETERISNLVAQLREIYRPHQDEQIELLSLTALIEETHSLLNAQLKQGHVTWVQDLIIDQNVSDLKIKVSSDQIKQVFINIGLNAIEAMQPSGGDLKVGLVRGDDNPQQIGVKFQDSGQGISQDAQSKIYEPFFTTKSNGLGLGLAICYDIVKRHNGSINLISKPGNGTTFTVWLPLTSNTENEGDP